MIVSVTFFALGLAWLVFNASAVQMVGVALVGLGLLGVIIAVDIFTTEDDHSAP
jgi:hypothetical protein